jgi:hypothetical protein
VSAKDTDRQARDWRDQGAGIVEASLENEPAVQPRGPDLEELMEIAWTAADTRGPLRPSMQDSNVLRMIFRTLTRLSVRFCETYLPDAFLLAILLTFVTAVIAVCVSGNDVYQILDAWYGGLWGVMPFAMQMALILCTGVALARSPVVRRGLRRLGGLPNGQTAAAVTVFLTAAIACWINCGFGLVVGALLAREIAKRLRRVDFSFLVAAGYMDSWSGPLVCRVRSPWPLRHTEAPSTSLSRSRVPQQALIGLF